MHIALSLPRFLRRSLWLYPIAGLMLLCGLTANVTAQNPSQADSQPTAAPDKIERPFLWRIEGPTPQYLLGTIHVPDSRVLALHPQIDQALDSMDELFVEIGPEDVDAQAKALLGADSDNRPALDPARRERIGQQLERIHRGLTFEHFQSAPVWAWALLLPSLKAQYSRPGQPVLDLKLIQAAQQSDIPVRSLEDPATQLAGFAELTRDEQLAFLDATLESLEDEAAADEDSLEEITTIYLRGAATPLAQLFEDEFSDDQFPEALRAKLLDALMLRRNREMAKRIQKALQEEPDQVHLFAAGAAHFVVQPSLLDLLTEAGYEITRVEPEAAPAVEAESRQEHDD